MATISVDTFLDGGVARTAGEAWTMKGAVLTIRTDTRWHANAPASMTGSIGATSISASEGGGILIDGRAVREVQFDTGTGNVPAIGTTITQGGTSAVLLGVWADLTSAPTAVGAAMPTTGFIKFREVTTGAFTAGALVGIGANATGPDTTSWIEVVQRTSVANSVPRLGFYRTRGAWYTLPQTTSGAANQVIQIPTNGGGANTHVPAVWIETGVGTNVYEAFPAVLGTWFLAANLATDARGKFVQTIGSGQVRIGFDGTANAGFVPPAGCRIRIPNILGRQCASGTDAVNAIPNATIANRPDWNTASAGDIDFEFFMDDWYHLFTSPFRVRHVNCATFDILSTSNGASPCDLNNFVTGSYLGTSIPLTLTANSLGGTIQDCKFMRAAAASNGHAASLSLCADYTFTRCHFGVIQFARSTGRSIATSQCSGLTFNDTFQYNGYTQHTTSFDITMTDLDHCDRFVGSTNTTTGMYAVACLTSCNNVTVNNLTFGLKGTLSGFHNPYLSPFYTINSSNITYRNAGTRSAPLAVASAALGPQYAVHEAGANTNVRAQRIYMQHTRTNALLTVNTSKNVTFESVHGTVGSVRLLSLNTLAKGIRATSNSTTGGASVYGTHVFDMFESDTAGRVVFIMNEPTAFSSEFVTLTLAGSKGGFTSAGGVSMPTVGDVLIIEMPYFALGHTALANAAATLTGTNTGNFTYEYSINTGTTWSSYQTLNGANLSGESITPSAGFKLRLRVTTATASATNALTYVRINTVSTLTAQTNNLYPLDTSTITISGLISGSRVQLFDVTNTVELFNGVVSGTTLTFAAPFTANYDCRVRVMRQNGLTAYNFIEFTDTVTVNGLTRSVSQTLDTIYGANAIDGSTVTGITIDDGDLLVNVDLGTVSLQSIYAYETYWLQTEEGIRDEQRFIRAIDQANYVFDGFKIKNVTDPTEPLVITGGYMVDSVTGTAIELIDTTGGTVFLAPEHVVPFASGSGVTPSDKTDIAALIAVDLAVINNNVKLASLLVPATEDLS